MLSDSDELRAILCRLFSSHVLEFEDVAKASGQRVVYFCRFSNSSSEAEMVPGLENAEEWGRVVLKVSQITSPNVVSYLKKEVEILNELESPHYPRLRYDEMFTHDPETEVPYPNRLFVTIEECVDAVPLSDLRNLYNDEVSVLHLIGKLVEALEPMWAHSKRLVHRDLKPDNILVTPDGEVVIIDLGIIREEGALGVTNSYAETGPCTIFYASPEQARNEKRNITFKSDFFALGVIAYELLDERNPFGVDTELFSDVKDRVCNHQPPSLESAGRCEKGFSELVERLMSKNPYQRHRRVSDLKESIEKLILQRNSLDVK